MTTDAAVAEPTTEQVTQPEVTQVDAPQSEAEKTENAVVETSASDTSAPENVEGEAAAFDFEAEWAKGAAEKPQTEDVKLPGKSEAEIAAEENTQRVQRYATIIAKGDQSVVDFAMSNLGLTLDEARAFWQQVRPVIADLHESNDAYNHAIFDKAAERALGDDYETYSKQRYDGRQQRIEAILKLGEARAEKRWVEALGFKTPAEVKKHAQEVTKRAIDSARRAGETSQEVASTGQSPNGRAASGRFSDINALYDAWIDKSIPRDVYEREHVRLTGKKPGE